jgi:hypothetical protein
MDLWSALQAFVLGVVEGLTEFLPISSTGHQIIVADLIGFGGERAMAFNIIIQLAAILAVVWEFRARSRRGVRLAARAPGAALHRNLLIAFLPRWCWGCVRRPDPPLPVQPDHRGDGPGGRRGDHALGRAPPAPHARRPRRRHELARRAEVGFASAWR